MFAVITTSELVDYTWNTVLSSDETLQAWYNGEDAKEDIVTSPNHALRNIKTSGLRSQDVMWRLKYLDPNRFMMNLC